ncbi:TetR/AcrR family transcriptional regulator [Paenibacillus anaericanus]|uniref:TetR/AcrR family transcriptional regulator n=1 Tax=Paenibacillus anaericanus TaxID=170367 RepID=A0A3S1DV02_9BACL|nr:TetR/AcrR family transcriptional regulator [Paenibacillus anaericanus]RUT47978.1 TetR/AcrR family transcriptional regulator [Paenibacillus anaericanus]
MTPRTREQNEEIRRIRMTQIVKSAADVYLDKGMLMEIRDVALEAGLGYGTVYHYYKNKNDLLHDLLWQAMDRAAEWMYGVAKQGNSNPCEFKDTVVSLMECWAEDHALYLLCKMSIDDFRSLSGEQAESLVTAYQEKVFIPLASLIAHETSLPLLNAKKRAQMLLASLIGCALPSLRVGSLQEDAKDIADFLLEGLIQRKKVQI